MSGICWGPGARGRCELPALYADGLCGGHHKQRARGRELLPLRGERLAVEMVGGGMRVSRECARALREEARRRRTSVYALVRDILERWARGL